MAIGASTFRAIYLVFRQGLIYFKLAWKSLAEDDLELLTSCSHLRTGSTGLCHITRFLQCWDYITQSCLHANQALCLLDYISNLGPVVFKSCTISLPRLQAFSVVRIHPSPRIQTGHAMCPSSSVFCVPDCSTWCVISSFPHFLGLGILVPAVLLDTTCCLLFSGYQVLPTEGTGTAIPPIPAPTRSSTNHVLPHHAV